FPSFSLSFNIPNIPQTPTSSQKISQKFHKSFAKFLYIKFLRSSAPLYLRLPSAERQKKVETVERPAKPSARKIK
ncbi:MAG: hypothetical protein KJ900_15410, partial [Proteobacteria bacterium]|nr:hypothetical protein [Pseudomonadota bacterium]MCG2742579.1 hypothetical protein [Desulfobacteraceae bacterium]MBU4029970.1 hypothetical protein [Pseudomonadota bacterium]MBU4044257.1 hypothetical protein [Pseudomonadota bacterium]MBU4083181.1 hypothetical protein [Pseudomonadota bacterium]